MERRAKEKEREKKEAVERRGGSQADKAPSDWDEEEEEEEESSEMEESECEESESEEERERRSECEEESEEEESEMDERAAKRRFVCSECGSSDRKHLALGLCIRCYEKQRRIRNEDVACVQCGHVGVYSKQRCHRCYFEQKQRLQCRRCHTLQPIRSLGMCVKCYCQWSRHERVARGFDFECRCGSEHPYGRTMKCVRCYNRFRRTRRVVDGRCCPCGNPHVISRGFCQSCYDRFLRNRVVAGVRCSRCGTDRIYSKSKSLCNRCYNLDLQERRSEGFVCDCGSTSFYQKNMCQNCYNKWRRTRVVAGFVCGCGSTSHHARGMCHACYQRWRKQQKKDDSDDGSDESE